MEKYIQEIQNAVEKAAIDGTLTRNAVEQFNGLIEETEKLEKENARQNKLIVDKNAEVAELTGKLTAAEALNKIAAEMEASLINREREITKLELKAKYMEMRVEDHQNMVGLIFRNTVVRRSVLGQELVAIPGTPDEVDQYGNTKFGTGRPPEATGVPVSKTEEEEEK